MFQHVSAHFGAFITSEFISMQENTPGEPDHPPPGWKDWLAQSLATSLYKGLVADLKAKWKDRVAWMRADATESSDCATQTSAKGGRRSHIKSTARRWKWKRKNNAWMRSLPGSLKKQMSLQAA